MHFPAPVQRLRGPVRGGIQRGRLNRRRKPKTVQFNAPTTRQPISPPIGFPASSPLPPSPSPSPRSVPSELSESPSVQSTALHSTRASSSAVCLAAARSTGIRDFMLQHVGRLSAASGLQPLERRRAFRAVHVGLAHVADHLDLEDFTAFMRGPRPTEPSPEVGSEPHLHSPSTQSPESSSSLAVASPSLPAALQLWSHPTTRPLFLEWSSTLPSAPLSRQSRIPKWPLSAFECSPQPRRIC